jgi:hypothetical protein
VSHLMSATCRSRGEAAVNGQTGTGDETDFGTGEVGDHAGDLVAMRVAFQGHEAFQGRGELPILRVHIRGHGAGLDGVDRDPTWAEITGETAREAGNDRFGHRVHGAARERHAIGVDAADGNDAPALAKVYPPAAAPEATRATADKLATAGKQPTCWPLLCHAAQCRGKEMLRQAQHDSFGELRLTPFGPGVSA